MKLTHDSLNVWKQSRKTVIQIWITRYTFKYYYCEILNNYRSVRYPVALVFNIQFIVINIQFLIVYIMFYQSYSKWGNQNTLILARA